MPNENLRALVKSLYKSADGSPLILSDGQLQIFEAITTKAYPFWHVMTTTQYGKSETSGLAVLTVVANYPEKFAIIAGKKDKAQIIMDYVISHIFDNELTRSRFVISKDENADSIRRKRNKQHLTFDVGNGGLGEVFIGSAKDALGFGAPNVIIDEAAFVEDKEFALVLRMLAGQKKIFLMKIGNPYFRNHFYKSFRDPDYKKIDIDYQQGLKEGRLNPEVVRKARDEADFPILYENKFPSEAAVDAKGYAVLLAESDLDRAYVAGLDFPFIGPGSLGFDVAGGGRNYSAIVYRTENAAKVLWRERTEDTMLVASKVVEFARQLHVSSTSIAGDEVGIGKGACDRVTELLGVYPGVNAGSAAEDKDRFLNLRAELYWKTRDWINHGGKLIGQGAFDELLDIRYKPQSDKKIKIKPKEEMRDDGIESPDVADALKFTFAKDAVYDAPAEDESQRLFDKYDVFGNVA
jgi:hypothetical protein